ncbi:MAG: DUF2064 domain-containing protein [Coriobacteriales bacterium]|nr:DUF2064 domain-containing protein [Coriobacteriales bacterium]
MEKKYAILLFSKPPVPGRVKTRLTHVNGGKFTPEQAAEFFKRSLWDVCELCMWCIDDLNAANEAERKNNSGAPKRTYDLIVSTTPKESIPLIKEALEEVGNWPHNIKYMYDHGATFDEHFDNAIREIFDDGYEALVSIGADIPTMPRSHISQAFQWLDYFKEVTGESGFVVAPCQECGSSLIGLNFDTPINNQGIYYNMDGIPALDGYVQKFKDSGVPCAYLTPVADVDEMSDLAHCLSCARALQQCAKFQTGIYYPRRLLEWADWMGITSVAKPNENHDPRQYIDDVDPDKTGAEAPALDAEETEGHIK